MISRLRRLKRVYTNERDLFTKRASLVDLADSADVGDRLIDLLALSGEAG